LTTVYLVLFYLKLTYINFFNSFSFLVDSVAFLIDDYSISQFRKDTLDTDQEMKKVLQFL